MIFDMPVRRALLSAIMAAAAVVLPGTVLANSSDHQRPIGIPLDPLFKLASHEGAPIARSDMRGKPFVVLFGYTNCDDLCPTSLFEASILLRELGEAGNRLPVLFVTVDPEHDTPAQLKTYLESFDERIVGLTGTREQIAAVTAAFAAPFRSADSADRDEGKHSSQLFFIDRYGLLAKPIDYSDTAALGNMAKRLLAQ